jgi:3-oxoacyl-[acyl-carrier-protein] synthase-3
MKAFVIGSGSYLPENAVPNEELSKVLQISPDQIFKSSGIRQRRWVNKGTTTSELAGKALLRSIDSSGIQLSDLDYLLFGTMTPDRFIPGTGPSLQHKLGLREIPCLDIRAGCCNALYGLQLARSLIVSGAVHDIALCLADIQSPLLEMSPRAATTSMLFGDGAASLIISATPRKGALEIIDVYLATDGQYVDDLGIRCPGIEYGNGAEDQDRAPRMVGQSVILQASRRMVAACKTILERNELEVNDVCWLVAHQANANLLTHVARGIGFINLDNVISVIELTGNTSSASMGLALDHLNRERTVREGDYVLLPAFAAGFTWGAALCRAV